MKLTNIVLILACCLVTNIAYGQQKGNETFYRTLTGYTSDRGTTITQGLGGNFTITQSPIRQNRGYTAPINPYAQSRQNIRAGRQISVVDWTN